MSEPRSFLDTVSLPVRRPTIRERLTGDILAVHEAALDRDARGGASAAVGHLSGSIAIIDVIGPLSQRAEADFFGIIDGYDAIEARFSEALRSSADAVVLRIDSPGGDAAGCFGAVRRMRAAAQAAGKPVVAFADEMAASAAYAIACVADSGIVVPASGEVGSVGVIAMHVSQSRALVDAGVDVTVFRSGKRKAEGTMAEPLSDDAAEAMQARVDALAQQFGALVAEARGMTADAVLGYEGAIFTAAEAVANGLADKVGTLDDAISMAARAASTRRKEQKMKEVKAALGLPESFDGDVADKVNHLVANYSALIESHSRVMTALGVKTADEAVGVVEGLKAMADLAAEAQKRAAELEVERAKAAVEEAIREGREARKITSASEGYWRTKSADEIRGFLKVAPVVIPGGDEDEEPKPAAVTGGRRWEDLSLAEKTAMQKADPEQLFALHREWKARVGRNG